MIRWAPLLLLGLVGLGCEAQQPEIDRRPSQIPDAAGPHYADLVISFTQAGAPVSCTDAALAFCSEQTGACEGHPAIGPPDDVGFTLLADGLIEVGFLCDPIVDRATGGELTADFRIWSTLEPNSDSAVVSVSVDGSSYVVLGLLDSNDKSFYLDDEALDFVRFVRIAGSANTNISVDAIEALQ